MKTKDFKYGLVILLGLSVSLISCETNTNLSDGIIAKMVTSDNEGTTIINTADLKSVTTGNDEITAEQTDWLKFMREEEKVAMDLYLAFGQSYTARVFQNIPRAEENHMNAVLAVMDTYGIEDPGSTESGIFTNPDLQALYNTLLDQGKVSLVEALKVGALVEETDIIDLAGVYDLNPGDDLKTLAEALLLGSRNHLRAFNRILLANGIVYTPVALDQAAFDAIVNSPWERGNELCNSISRGNGNQYRNGSGTCNGAGGKGFRFGRRGK